jgi:hypothetical protein
MPPTRVIRMHQAGQQSSSPGMLHGLCLYRVGGRAWCPGIPAATVKSAPLPTLLKEGTTVMYPDLQIKVARHYQRETLAQAHQQRLRRQAQSATRESRCGRAAQQQPGRPLGPALRLLTSRAPGATRALRSAAGPTISPQLGSRGTYPRGHDHDVR